MHPVPGPDDLDDLDELAGPLPAGAEPVAVERAVPGGVMLGRLPSGEVVLVDGGLPGELVRVEPVDGPGRVRRGRAVTVVGPPSPDRVAAPCPHRHRGCGGCDWQHVAVAAQARLKAEAVVDALARLGRIVEPQVALAPALPATGYRTTVHAHVDDDGRAGWFGARSHDVVAVDSCMVAHPLVEEVLVSGRFPGQRRVTIRASAATGQRLVVVDDGTVPVAVPHGVAVLDRDTAGEDEDHVLEEVVAGRRLRVSALSFFQARPDGAETLVATAADLLGPWLTPRARLVDLYAGVGLFAVVLADRVARVTTVESSRSSVADAVHNLRGVDGASVVRSRVERWRPARADVVIADPPREGLGRPGVGAIAATGAGAVALVSCDAGALGRDAGLLAKAGYAFQRAVLVDMFPHTHHCEVVSLFRLGA